MLVGAIDVLSTNFRLNHIEKPATASQFWNIGHETDNSATLIT